ncbi:hypothetical protein [Paenibacillus sp. IHB B 3084]|uniref:hypothetical protein n=1 Tax=Paenibacillus sp. IHB B 3084 TaxID=867076 RepID=UPI000A409AB1|nr:hypothetical protein [Paenibacillus sp. IHB B 3084]
MRRLGAGRHAAVKAERRELIRLPIWNYPNRRILKSHADDPVGVGRDVIHRDL